MTGTLPELIDPLEFVDKRRQLRGSLPLARMERLVGVIRNGDDRVLVELAFGKEDRIPVMTGQINATLVLECQCCMEPMTWPVASAIRLGMVMSIDEGNLLPDSLEPLLLEGDALVSLSELVEDELLLAIPDIPQHSSCTTMARPVPLPPREQVPESSFAVLAQLKDKI